jgi:hypothetical protein
MILAFNEVVRALESFTGDKRPAYKEPGTLGLDSKLDYGTEGVNPNCGMRMALAD